MWILDVLRGTQRPAAGIAAVAKAELKQRVLGLNRDTAPWHIRDGSDEGCDLVAMVQNQAGESPYITDDITTPLDFGSAAFGSGETVGVMAPTTILVDYDTPLVDQFVQLVKAGLLIATTALQSYAYCG